MEEAGEGAGGDEAGDGFDVGREGAIVGEFGRERANGIEGLASERAGVQRSEKIDALAGTEEFDRKNVLEIVEHALETASAAHAHGDVVFLIAGSGDGIDRMRRGESAVFAGERSGGDLGNHEAGIEAGMRGEEGGKKTGERIGHLLDTAFRDAAESGNGNGELVGGHGERLAVEIAAGDDVAFGVFFGEHERIVGGAVELHKGHFAGLNDGVANGTVHLRSATEGVGVLNARVLIGSAVGFANGAAFIEMSEIAGGDAGTGVGTGVHDAGIESAGTAAEGVEGKSGGDVGGVYEDIGVMESEAEKSEHALRAVEEGQAFLGFEGDRSDFAAAEGFGAGKFFVLEVGFAFADHDLSEMGERREIAGSADGTLRRNDGMNAGIEHGDEGFHDDGTNAAEALGESVGAKKHHGADFGGGERCAYATGMRANEIDLKLADLFGGDAHGGKFAEAGVDAVGGFSGSDERINDGARGQHAGDRVGREGNLFVMESDGVELGKREVVTGKRDQERFPSE